MFVSSINNPQSKYLASSKTQRGEVRETVKSKPQARREKLITDRVKRFHNPPQTIYLVVEPSQKGLFDYLTQIFKAALGIGARSSVYYEV